MRIRDELSFIRIVRDGSVLSALFTLFLFGTAAYEPEIWVHDYPPDIREKWGPKSDRANRLTKIVAPLFLLVFFGGIFLSNWRLRQRNDGWLSFGAAFVNAYAVYMFINLFDMAIMDWLLFVRLQPRFIVLPGTEGMAGYDDYLFHAKASAKGSVLGLVVSLIIAMLTMSWGNKK